MQHVLIIGTVWVEPNSSAAGARMLQLIQLFLQQTWQVTFACAAQKSTNSISLKALGVKEEIIVLNSSTFDEFITGISPTIVVFDRFLTEEQFGWRVAENCPNALRILDSEDLHFLRKVRHQQYKKEEEFTIEALLASDDTKREIASILRCDLTLIISTFEMELLTNVFKIDKNLLYYLPFLLYEITSKTINNWVNFEKREYFVFIGNYHHKPNINAVITLKNHIWESIKKQLPNAELHIYGAYVNQQIKQLHNDKEGFLIKGFIKDANEVISHSKIMLAPLNFGAGIKGKLTDAMCLGTPSITTIIGAEGMHKNLPWNGFVTNDFKEFSNKAVTLYTSKKHWLAAQKNGVEIINTVYNINKLSVPFIDTISATITSLKKHRLQNFFGSMLQLQTLQSTKFMSKWIEEKNK